MSLREQLQADLTIALRSRDASRTKALRTTLAAIANAEAVDPTQPTMAAGLPGDVARRGLSPEEVRAIVAAEHQHLCALAEEMLAVGRPDEAGELTARAEAVATYLTT